MVTMKLFLALSVCYTLFGTGVFSLDEEGKKPEAPLLLEEELNGVGTTPPTDVASGDFSSEVSSQILDANVLIFIASHSHRCRRHAPIDTSSPGNHIRPN
jgi:hypothetical protein